MNAATGVIANSTNNDSIRKEAWLLGQPPLQKFLDFVEENAIGGEKTNKALLVDQWRAANDLYYELEKSEGGVADGVGIADLPKSLSRLVKAVRRDSRFRRAFETLPARFAMVELSKLVVSQPHINLSHVENLKAKLGSTPDPAELFRFCLPLGQPAAPVHVRKTGSSRYALWSESSDFRFHEPSMFAPEQVSGYDSFGPVGAILGLVVGFGSNFLTAIQSDNRLLLHNGHHRAYALHDLGITHAPCLVQVVTRRDELNLVAPRDVCEAPAFYFKSPRPPVLRDFFDPRLRTILNVHKVVRMIELSFEARDVEVRDFASPG